MQIPNLNSCENNEIDEGLNFMDYWSDQTVKRERGLSLRESKPVPFYSKDLNTFRRQLNLNDYRIKVDYRNKVHDRRSYTLKTKILPHRQKCSLRIIELSVPTKRHCIDTWRNKYHILPGFMLERLKRQVLDRQPIVQISDAHNCFKNRKRIKITSKRRKKVTVNGKHKYPMDIKYFCALFCYKIVQKLNKASIINIDFNSELDNLSKIVAGDIREIMQKRTDSDSSFGSKCYRKFYNEISVKVTLWLSNILDEASFMMLLDDLNELEEEEGPVFSFIDDLLYNVLHICQTNSPKHSDSCESIRSAIESQLTGSILVAHENSKKHDNLDENVEEFVPDEDDVNNVLVNEIFTIIDTVIKNVNFYETDQASLSIDSDKEIKHDSVDVDNEYTFKNNNFNGSMKMNEERENYVNAEVIESDEKNILIMATEDFVTEVDNNINDAKDETNDIRNVNETDDSIVESKSTKTDQDDHNIDIDEQSSLHINNLENDSKFNSKQNTEQNSHKNDITDEIKDVQEVYELENNRSVEGKLNTSDQESNEFVMSNTKDSEISNELDKKPSLNIKSNDSYQQNDESDIKDDTKYEIKDDTDDIKEDTSHSSNNLEIHSSITKTNDTFQENIKKDIKNNISQDSVNLDLGLNSMSNDINEEGNKKDITYNTEESPAPHELENNTIIEDMSISMNPESYYIEKADIVKEIQWSFSLEKHPSTESDPNNKDQDKINDMVAKEKINENQKKVAFSELKIDKLGSPTESSNQTNRSSAEKLLDLAPPNVNLLSDADETWPKQMSFLSIHESISLSATSLGRIVESDNSGSS